MSELMEFKPKTEHISEDSWIFLNPKVSLRACGLYAKIMILPSFWNFSIRNLASICGDSEKVVKRTLDELKQLGYLKVEKINGDGGKFRYVYYFRQTITEDNCFEIVLCTTQN